MTHLGWGNTPEEKFARAAAALGCPVPDVDRPDWRMWIEETVEGFLVQGAGRLGDDRSYFLRCRDGTTELAVSNGPEAWLDAIGTPEVEIEWDDDHTCPEDVWRVVWPILCSLGKPVADWSMTGRSPWVFRVEGHEDAVEILQSHSQRTVVDIFADRMTAERWRALAGSADRLEVHVSGEGGSGRYMVRANAPSPAREPTAWAAEPIIPTAGTSRTEGEAHR